jgi:DNA-binding response OmpR family regulator
MAEVILVRWPEDGADGLRLAASGVAVLYLIDGDDDPPTPTTCLEDWVRIPGDERDLRARIAALELRSTVHLAPPRVAPDGRLHYRGKVTVLPTEQIELARLLTEHFGETVTDAELPATARGELRVKISRLRAQLRDIDLLLRRVRRRGYTLRAR